MSRSVRGLSLQSESNAGSPSVETLPDHFLAGIAAGLPGGDPESSPTATARVHELESRLAERERLVAILTERLEHTADELDRLKRSGGPCPRDNEKELSSSQAEEIHGTQELLRQFYDAWQERYEGPGLRRIENQLEELRELMSTRPAAPQSAPSMLAAYMSRSENGATTSAGGSVDTEQATAAGLDLPRSVACAEPVRIVLLTPADALPEDEVPLPAAVDPEAHTLSELMEAVDVRDRYISWLCHRVRTVTGHLDEWLQRVTSSDCQLQQRIDEVEQLVHEQLGLVEVELSVERARMAREQARAAHAMQELTREREHPDRRHEPASAEGSAPASVKRWRRFLGCLALAPVACLLGNEFAPGDLSFLLAETFQSDGPFLLAD